MIALLLALFACNHDAEQPKAPACTEDVAVFTEHVWEPVLGQQCIACHVEGGMAQGSALRLDPDDLLASLRSARSVGNRLLLKPTGQHTDGHGGGEVVAPGSAEALALEFWVNWGSGICEVPESAPCFDENAPRRLRRLTHTEYGRSIEDLLGIDATDFAAGLAADPEVDGFKNDAAALVVGPLLADQYRTTAEAIAWAAPIPVDCDPGATGDAICAQQSIEDFGFRAFRRPLTLDELDAYQDFWAGVAEQDGFEESMRWTVAAILQSPHFLYRSELGVQSNGQFALTDWEIATELSYTFWGTTPDAQLLAAAEAGFTDTSLDEQVTRLATDPRTLETVADLVEVWLHLDLLATVSRVDLTDDIRAAMADETRDLVIDVAASDGSLTDLMFSRHTFVDADLAQHYGLAGTGRVDLDGAKYGGLLTQGSVLTTHARPTGSSPVHRGVLVRERLLCEDLPPPPANLDTSPPPVDPTLSTRERYAEHSANPACASCHERIDPLGFGFEQYDGIGRWRADDAGHAIDASGSVDGADFDGVFELAQALTDDERFRTCFVKTWRRHATGAEACADDPGDVTLLGPLQDLVGLDGFTVRAGGLEEGDTLASGKRPDLEPPDEIVPPLPDSFELTEVSNWGTGYCSDGVVTNMGAAAWTWEVRAPNAGTVTSIWNANATVDGVDLLFTGVDWNATLDPGAVASFGFCADL